MTAFIGYCLDEGVCFASDTQRNHYDTGTTSQVKKIVDLTSEMLISTGGLGTIGHTARDIVRSSVQRGDIDPTNLKDIISKTQQVFRQAYEESFEEDPDHDIPLYVLIAGRRPDDGTGFIWLMKSNNEFRPVFIDEPGNSFFTGSDTYLVQTSATTVYRHLEHQFEKLPFDIWSAKSIQMAERGHKEIGSPIQLKLIDSKGTTDRYPVDWLC